MPNSQESEEPNSSSGELLFARPQAVDGMRVHDLIAACPPLDPNSIYCNLLQCHHFADTSVKVEQDGELVGFISGFIPPAEPDVLFIWQVAVASAARGRGLGRRMLSHLIDRPACAKVRFLHTTVTPDNKASLAMFAGFARAQNASINKQVLFDRHIHFQGLHDSEELHIIGPLR